MSGTGNAQRRASGTLRALLLGECSDCGGVVEHDEHAHQARCVDCGGWNVRTPTRGILRLRTGRGIAYAFSGACDHDAHYLNADARQRADTYRKPARHAHAFMRSGTGALVSMRQLPRDPDSGRYVRSTRASAPRIVRAAAGDSGIGQLRATVYARRYDAQRVTRSGAYVMPEQWTAPARRAPVTLPDAYRARYTDAGLNVDAPAYDADAFNARMSARTRAEYLALRARHTAHAA